MDLPILNISYTWNQTSCGLLCLISFTQHNATKVHPCRSMGQDFMPFYGWIIFHCALHCLPQIHLLKSYPLVPQKVTAFGDRAFKEVVKLTWDHEGRLQYDWCPNRERRSRHRHTQKDDHVKILGEGCHRHTKKRGLRKNQTCWHLDLGLPASSTVRKKISVV